MSYVKRRLVLTFHKGTSERGTSSGYLCRSLASLCVPSQPTYWTLSSCDPRCTFSGAPRLGRARGCDGGDELRIRRDTGNVQDTQAAVGKLVDSLCSGISSHFDISWLKGLPWAHQVILWSNCCHPRDLNLSWTQVRQISLGRKKIN